MIKGNFEFHPVGHGLFYSGRIFSSNEFNFIFDCGGQLISNAVNDYKNNVLENDKLDILFISHLHEDHINGIPHLLSSISNNCERVILPYFTPFQRLFLAAEYLFGGDGPKDPNDPDGSSSPNNDDEVFDIIINPHSYFLKKNINVVYIYNGHDNNESFDEDFNKGDDDNYEPKERNLKIIISETDNIDEINSIEGEYLNSDQNSELSVKLLDGNKIKLDRYWKFIVYNRAFCDDTLKVFKQEVFAEFKNVLNGSEVFTAKSLNTIISKTKFKSKLRNLYNKIFSKEKINDYGLMLIHRPVMNRLNFNLCYNECPSHYKFRFLRDCYFCYRHNYRDKYLERCCGGDICNYSTLLTGDRPLELLMDNDISINGELSNVHVFQVPHHGSGTGWDKTQLNYISLNCKNKKAIICHGYRYNLPKINVIHDLQNCNYDIKLVHKIPFKYNIIRFGN